MSDKPEGPGWWIASDGNWYPPELHPSVREGSRMQSPVDTPVRPAGSEAAEGSQASRWQGNADDEHIGPQFPDLFQKALQGSHLADNVTVNGFDDEGPQAARGSTGARGGAPVGAGTGPSNRRRWRRGT